MTSLLRLHVAATVIAMVPAALTVATVSAAHAETGCKSGSVVSGPAHGWHLRICKTPRDATSDTFSWTAGNTDSGAAVATVSYTVQCTGGTQGYAFVTPTGPVSWGNLYSPSCAFLAELTVNGAPGPGGAPIILRLAAG